MLSRKNLVSGLSVFSGAVYATSTGTQNVGAVKIVDEVRTSFIDFFEYLPNYDALNEEERYIAKAILVIAKSEDISIDVLIYLYESASVIHNFARKRKEDEKKNKDVPLVNWISSKVYKFINFPVTFYYYFFQKNSSDKIYEEALSKFFEAMAEYKEEFINGRIENASKEISHFLVFCLEKKVPVSSFTDLLSYFYSSNSGIQKDCFEKFFDRIESVLDYSYDTDKIKEEDKWSVQKIDAFEELKDSVMEILDSAIKKEAVSFENMWECILKDNRTKDLCAMLKELDESGKDFRKGAKESSDVSEEQLKRVVKFLSNYWKTKLEQEKESEYKIINPGANDLNRIGNNINLINQSFENKDIGNNNFNQINNSAASNCIGNNSINFTNMNFDSENNGSDNNWNNMSNNVAPNQNPNQIDSGFSLIEPN